MCLHVGVMGVCMHVCVKHMEARALRMGFFLTASPPYCYETGSLQLDSARQTSQLSLRDFSLLCLPSAGIRGTCHHAGHFTWVKGVSELGLFMLECQAFYPPAPILHFFLLNENDLSTSSNPRKHSNCSLELPVQLHDLLIFLELFNVLEGLYWNSRSSLLFSGNNLVPRLWNKKILKGKWFV